MVDQAFWQGWLPIGISSLALLVSAGSFSYAARTYGINKRKEEKERGDITVYYDRGYKDRVANEDVYRFVISATNMSTLANAITAAQLHIDYERAGRESTFVADCSLSSADASDGLDVLKPPVSLTPSQTINGWLVFRIDRHLLEEARVVALRVVLKPARGAMPSFQPIFLRPHQKATGADHVS